MGFPRAAAFHHSTSPALLSFSLANNSISHQYSIMEGKGRKSSSSVTVVEPFGSQAVPGSAGSCTPGQPEPSSALSRCPSGAVCESRVRAGQRRNDLLICMTPSKLFLTQNLRVNEVWHSYLYISKEETPHSVILAMALAKSTEILIPEKKGHSGSTFLFGLGLFFFFEKSPLCPVTEAGSFHVSFS